MEPTTTKTYIPSCLIKGPGPKYGLPGLTGYINHDPTRRVEPAYTIPSRNSLLVPQSDNPGPNKYAVYNKTNRGPLSAPAYTVGIKPQYKIDQIGPSPADYKVEKIPPVNHQKRAPMYTMRPRPKSQIQSTGPGPNTLLPSCIGPKIPDKKAEACYTMAFSKPKQHIDDLPGPAAYQKVDISVVKKRCPAYSLRFKTPIKLIDDVPGPKYNAQKIEKRAPTFAFGIKHSQCAVLPITPEDEP